MAAFLALGQADVYEQEAARLGDEQDFACWMARSVEKRDKLQLPPVGSAEAFSWTGRGGVVLLGVANSERQRDALNLGFSALLKKELKLMMEIHFLVKS